MIKSKETKPSSKEGTYPVDGAGAATGAVGSLGPYMIKETF
jgi:hypothetical protein